MGVSDRQMPHDERWVRYFLDVESKYAKGFSRTDLIPSFMGKLASRAPAGAAKEGTQAVTDPIELENQGPSLSLKRVNKTAAGTGTAFSSHFSQFA